jgi:hypothetical protein
MPIIESLVTSAILGIAKEVIDKHFTCVKCDDRTTTETCCCSKPLCRDCYKRVVKKKVFTCPSCRKKTKVRAAP